MKKNNFTAIFYELIASLLNKKYYFLYKYIYIYMTRIECTFLAPMLK